jgi:hypothetical protein
MRWLAPLRKAAALPRAERGDLARALAALAAAQLRVWTRPAGRLVRPGATAVSAEWTAGEAAHAARLARAVDRAATAFRATCLVRALALHRLLDADGLPGARIRLGVRPDAGRLHAHAWVEFAGTVLGDDGRRAHAFQPFGAGALPLDARSGG